MYVESKKALEILLSEVPRFPNPNRYLEQYICDSTIASELLWSAYMHGDIANNNVADFGCGTGILSYGSLLLGAKNVYCIDIDCDILLIAKNFISQMFTNIHYICSDINYLGVRNIDTVVMNPPFGVYRRGIDITFLIKGFENRPKAIYSIHKYNYASHRLIYEVANKFRYKAEVLTLGYMSIPQIYETHRKRIHRFRIAVYRFTRMEI